MKVVENIVFTICFLALLWLGVKILTTPNKDEVEKIVVGIIENPERCRESHPDKFHEISQIGWKGSEMKLKIKISALPKRIDYFIVKKNGDIVAEVIYRVDAKCDGIYIENINSSVSR